MFFYLQLANAKEYKHLQPVQEPIAPPYEQACRLKKADLLAKPSTSKLQSSSSPIDSINDD